MREKSAGTRRTSSKPDKELPELSDEMLSRAVLIVAVSALVARHPRTKVSISLRLPSEVLKRWRASGSGWQTRMAKVLAKRAP